MNYADNLTLLVNTPALAEAFLHSLEQPARGIDLYVNANKTEYIRFKQKGAVSTFCGQPLKFTYLGNNISSTESDVNIRLAKAWNAINWLSIQWKFDLSDEPKRDFFQGVTVSLLRYGCTTWTLTQRFEKKLDENYTRILLAVLNKSWWQHS